MCFIHAAIPLAHVQLLGPSDWISSHLQGKHLTSSTLPQLSKHAPALALRWWWWLGAVLPSPTLISKIPGSDNYFSLGLRMITAQGRPSSLMLDWQAIGNKSSPFWTMLVLKTGLRSSGRAERTLSHRLSSLAPISFILTNWVRCHYCKITSKSKSNSYPTAVIMRSATPVSSWSHSPGFCCTKPS